MSLSFDMLADYGCKGNSLTFVILSNCSHGFFQLSVVSDRKTKDSTVPKHAILISLRLNRELCFDVEKNNSHDFISKV